MTSLVQKGQVTRGPVLPVTMSTFSCHRQRRYWYQLRQGLSFINICPVLQHNFDKSITPQFKIPLSLRFLFYFQKGFAAFYAT